MAMLNNQMVIASIPLWRVMEGGRSNGTANFWTCRVILHRGAQGLRGIHMPLGWVERRGFYFPGMACQRLPACPCSHRRATECPFWLVSIVLFFWGVNKWRNYETMRFWPTLAVFFLISVVQPHRHQEELPSCLDGEWEPISYKHPSPGSCGKGHDFTDHNSKPLSLSLHRPCPILEKPSSKPSN